MTISANNYFSTNYKNGGINRQLTNWYSKLSQKKIQNVWLFIVESFDWRSKFKIFVIRLCWHLNEKTNRTSYLEGMRDTRSYRKHSSRTLETCAIWSSDASHGYIVWYVATRSFYKDTSRHRCHFLSAILIERQVVKASPLF